MASQIIYTCDRCKKKSDPQTDFDRPPWAQIRIALRGVIKLDGHLCGDCAPLVIAIAEGAEVVTVNP